MARTSVTDSFAVTGVEAALPIPAEATTSRTLVSNDAVRVVVFAMDAGQELTDHAAPRPVVVGVIEGSLRFRLLGAEYDLGPGDTVYLAPSERHSLVATTPCRFALTLITAQPAAPPAGDR